jgi:hypothetical protein
VDGDKPSYSRKSPRGSSFGTIVEKYREGRRVSSVTTTTTTTVVYEEDEKETLTPLQKWKAKRNAR